MREVTVKEFVEALKGEILEINADDSYGLTVQMSKARIDYDELMVTYDSDIIESIVLDEGTGEYTVSFTECMPDITIKKFK